MTRRAALCLLAALSACEPQPPAAPFFEALGHPDACRNDRYFVDLPIWIERLPEGFEAELRRRMTEAVRGNLGWICAQVETCAQHAELVRERVFADVRPVLPPRDTPQRADGHRRFWRVAFYAAPWPVDTTGRRLEGDALWFEEITRLEVPREAACGIVSRLRDAAGAASGLEVGQDLFVGRACLATNMGAAHHADEAMQRWHLDRIGWSAPGAAPLATVALIDTGVPADLADEIGVVAGPTITDPLPPRRTAEGDPLEPPRGTPHRHGSAMALLTRQVAPEARIVDLPALDANGRATIAHVAQALDAAVFDLGGPLVVNLSVGWPPELERRRILRGPPDAAGAPCVVDEDPVGESIRYALWLAQRRDRGGLPDSAPTLVVAAAGNRPPVLADADAAYAARFEAEEAPDPCTPARPGDLFYPAAWANRGACGPDGQPVPPLALAVGASDDRDRRAGLSAPGPSPALVAPGQHVWVTRAQPDPEPLACAVDPPLWRGFPATFSGSSVAAALVSGVATRLHGPLSAAGLSPEAPALAWALTFGGTPAPEVGVGVRRLDVVGTEALLGCPDAAAAFAACAQDPATCVEAATACGAPAEPAASAEPIGWPADYPRAACTTVEAEIGLMSAEDLCDRRPAPPPCAAPDRYSAGDAGPQPIDNGCPECLALLELLSPGEGKIRLELQINPALPSGTVFTEPWLYVYWPDGRKEVTDLGPFTDPAQWAPGAWLSVEGIEAMGPSDLQAQWADADAYLVTSLRTPDQTTPSADVSVLRVK